MNAALGVRFLAGAALSVDLDAVAMLDIPCSRNSEKTHQRTPAASLAEGMLMGKNGVSKAGKRFFAFICFRRF